MGRRDDGLDVRCDDAPCLSRAAFAGRRDAAAYHELIAACVAVADVEDDARLADVGALADEQCAWLDADAPRTNCLSARSAARRGRHSLWATPGHWADTRRQMLEQRRTMRQTPPHAGP